MVELIEYAIKNLDDFKVVSTTTSGGLLAKLNYEDGVQLGVVFSEIGFNTYTVVVQYNDKNYKYKKINATNPTLGIKKALEKLLEDILQDKEPIELETNKEELELSDPNDPNIKIVTDQIEIPNIDILLRKIAIARWDKKVKLSKLCEDLNVDQPKLDIIVNNPNYPLFVKEAIMDSLDSSQEKRFMLKELCRRCKRAAEKENIDRTANDILIDLFSKRMLLEFKIGQEVLKEILNHNARSEKDFHSYLD